MVHKFEVHDKKVKYILQYHANHCKIEWEQCIILLEFQTKLEFVL